MKNKRKLSEINCVRTKSGCVTWDGPEITCLDICPGDELNDFLYALSQKICEAASGSDLSTLSLQCLIDKLGVTIPTERNILTLLQLSFDNECLLKDLIDDLNDKIANPNAPLNIDMKCLTVVDGFGTPLAITQIVLDQVLINEFCALKNRVSALELKDIDLQAQIDAIDVTPYILPTLTTCWAGTRNLSSQISTGFQNLCDYRDIVGTITDIQAAISAQPAGLNPTYAINPNWKLTPNSDAQTDINQWIVIDDLLKRIIAIEDCACKFTCKDVTVGFLTTFNDDKTVTLKFTNGAGTFIPDGFEDCGTLLTIRNDNNIKTNPITVIVSQEGISDDIDISMFEVGEYLTFSMEVNLCSEKFNCQKCVSKTVRNTAGCCLITNNDTEDITIIYKICGITAPTT